VTPVVEKETPVRRERLFHCEHFSVWRHTGQSAFTVGAAGVPRVLIGIEGTGQVEYRGATYAVDKGDLLLLPAEVGACSYKPRNAVSLLEIALPE
jgi:mannose-6-phosphate isomerase